MSKTTDGHARRIKDAEALVHKILVRHAGQSLDADTITAVAHKVVKSLPPLGGQATKSNRVSAARVST
jgi:hypothetical protein